MWIECSEFNLKLLLFLIYPIFRIVQDYTYEAYIKEDKDNNLFTTFRCYLSFIFGGISLLIFNHITKRRKKEIEIDMNLLLHKDEDKKDAGLSQIEITINKMERKKILHIIKYQVLISIIGLFSFYFGYKFKEKEYSYTKYSFRPFVQIANFSLFSYILLKQKLYKHHFISYGCITLMLAIMFIISFQYLQKIWYALLYYFISELVYAIYDVLIKRFMLRYFKSPYFIMFFLGVAITVAFLIYDTIAYFANRDISGIIIGFQDNITSVGDFFFFLLDLIFLYIWNLGIWLIISNFTPCHYFISDYLSEFIYFIWKRFQKKNDPFYNTDLNYFSIIICNIFIFFFCLIFNEVVLLNFCGLDYNTKKRIERRQQKEMIRITKESEMTSHDSITEERTSDGS